MNVKCSGCGKNYNHVPMKQMVCPFCKCSEYQTLPQVREDRPATTRLEESRGPKLLTEDGPYRR